MVDEPKAVPSEGPKEISGRAHLSDLFKVGTEVTIESSEGEGYPLWVQRPTAVQQDEAREAANARMIRIKQQYDNKKGDRYETLSQTMKEIEDLEALLDMRVQYKSATIREQAFNEVLYEDEGTDWQLDNRYLSLITAITDRWDEITRYNEEMEKGGSEDRILPEKDQDLQELMSKQEEFQAEVTERVEELTATERKLHENKPIAQLRNEVVKESIETEARLYWYETYQTRMLHYACRQLDDHDLFYFSLPEDVMELPAYIRQELYQAYEALERSSEEVKNSLSLPSSLA